METFLDGPLVEADGVLVGPFVMFTAGDRWVAWDREWSASEPGLVAAVCRAVEEALVVPLGDEGCWAAAGVDNVLGAFAAAVWALGPEAMLSVLSPEDWKACDVSERCYVRGGSRHEGGRV